MSSPSNSSHLFAFSARAAYLHSWQLAVRDVTTDCRDEWATDIHSDYNMGDVLSSGKFGMLIGAHGRDFTCGAAQSAQPRACAVKVVYLARKFDQALEECGSDEAKFVRRIEAMTARLMTELFILTRCRHQNILHAHAISVAGGDLYIVLPRLYSLETLIEKYRGRYNGESMSIRFIMMIVRQICLGIDFLQRVGIIHRDIHPEYIFLTRGGTVKLGHFGSARALDCGGPKCLTPVGKKEFMCYEKQFNLFTAESREECLEYGSAADIWSLGVIVLRMISYFPNEKWHRLPVDFAITMHEENMPFKWMIAEMMQLRVRLAKCGGSEDLRNWLSDSGLTDSNLGMPLLRLLTMDPSRRATAAELLETGPVKRICHDSVEKDKSYLAKHLILNLDWSNRLKLEMDRPNYDALESKDIPADFYWDDFESWKILEITEFGYKITVEEETLEEQKRKTFIQGSFIFSRAHELLAALMKEVHTGAVSFIDLLTLDHQIHKCAFVALRARLLKKSLTHSKPEASFSLPDTLSASKRTALVSVHIVAIRE